MLETVRCPSCSTRYGLKPERISIGIRRAKCVRCEDIFDVGDSVARLLAALDEPAMPEASQPVAEAFPMAEPPPESNTSSLTLGELGADDDEILEKTLTIEPSTLEPLDGGTYSSAKDAISKLLGESPLAQKETGPRRGHTMDVEATLSALENTLGGVTAGGLATTDETAAAGTLHLSPQDLQAAMAKPAPSVASPAGPSLTQVAPSIPLEEPSPADPNLLKIKVGNDVYNNLTVEQITAWIAEGRVLDFHMVARQHSENWIEAVKVPQLRPIFERKKRVRAEQAQVLLSNPPSMDTLPIKKSLFGGLFKS